MRHDTRMTDMETIISWLPTDANEDVREQWLHQGRSTERVFDDIFAAADFAHAEGWNPVRIDQRRKDPRDSEPRRHEPVVPAAPRHAEPPQWTSVAVFPEGVPVTSLTQLADALQQAFPGPLQFRTIDDQLHVVAAASS